MNTLTDIPVSSVYARGRICVTMSSGREFAFPCSDYPVLAQASAKDRAHMELSPFGIHWPTLDEDLSIAGLLRDHANC